MNSVIEAHSVSKNYHVIDGNQFWRIIFDSDQTAVIAALQDISLSVPKGEFIGIIGRNGSGKSTFLRVVGGVYAPCRGVINLSDSMSAIYELGLTHNKFLTGRSFAKRWLDFFNQCRKNDLEKYIQEIYEFSELADFFDKPIYKYSSGMKARLFFSIATAVPGKIYLIDEALSVGDEYFQSKCWKRLRELFKTGASGILVTHDWSAVLKICQTTYWFDKGRIVEHGESRTIVRRYLNLELPEPGYATFSENLLPSVKTRSLEDFEFEIPISLSSQCDVYLAYSIEIFERGKGWEHLLHLDKTFVSNMTVGQHTLKLSIPSLPLKPGEYYLNLFLYYRVDGAHEVGVSLSDVRSWTYGNEITLAVDDGLGKGGIVLPLTWELSDPDAH